MRRFKLIVSILLPAILAACGGGGPGGMPSPGGTTPPEPTLAQREAAARSVAQTHANCLAVQPFYWSVGDSSGTLAGATSSATAGGTSPGADTQMSIASASKWLYGAWVAELRGGTLTASDIRFLNFTSGYTEFDVCLQTQTVAQCQSTQTALIHNGSYVAANDGKFFYSGGHMQKHATDNGLGGDVNATLAQDIRSRILPDMALAYAQPQLAGGVVTSGAEYGRVLRRMVTGELKIGALLGSQAVCTNPSTCAQAVATPIPRNESWHYTLGHWVEDDPVVGDGAFSSAGAFGFYPWVDKDRRYWGCSHATAPTAPVMPMPRNIRASSQPIAGA